RAQSAPRRRRSSHPPVDGWEGPHWAWRVRLASSRRGWTSPASSRSGRPYCARNSSLHPARGVRAPPFPRPCSRAPAPTRGDGQAGVGGMLGVEAVQVADVIVLLVPPGGQLPDRLGQGELLRDQAVGHPVALFVVDEALAAVVVQRFRDALGLGDLPRGGARP